MNAAAMHPIDRLRAFFSVQIWDARPAELPRAKAALFRVSRLAYSTVRGFIEDQLTVRAAALTYFSILSIVPFLAFTFAVLKGFGAYQTFIDGIVRPYLADTFAPNPALHQAIEKILQFVDQTDVSRLGAIGLVVLVYTSISLVSSIEDALNDVFDAKTHAAVLAADHRLRHAARDDADPPVRRRHRVRRGPELERDRLLAGALRLGPVIDFGLGFTPLAVVGLAFFAMYVILPNVRVRPLSALLGAALAAVGWQVSLVLHVQLQMGVAKYNALYSVLGALPDLPRLDVCLVARRARRWRDRVESPERAGGAAAPARKERGSGAEGDARGRPRRADRARLPRGRAAADALRARGAARGPAPARRGDPGGARARGAARPHRDGAPRRLRPGARPRRRARERPPRRAPPRAGRRGRPSGGGAPDRPGAAAPPPRARGRAPPLAEQRDAA